MKTEKIATPYDLLHLLRNLTHIYSPEFGLTSANIIFNEINLAYDMLLLSEVEKWGIRNSLEVITTHIVKNILGVFNVDGFPSNFCSGHCINLVIQLAIKVRYSQLTLFLFFSENKCYVSFKFKVRIWCKSMVSSIYISL